MRNRIAANLVLGADGSTTLNGSSRGLSFPADRLRFHQLRSQFVLSHRPLPLPLKASEEAVAWNLPLPEAIARATTVYGDIILEAGPDLVTEALRAGLLTELFVTISPVTPKENQIDLAELVVGGEEIARESIDSLPGALFLHFRFLNYRLAPSHD